MTHTIQMLIEHYKKEKPFLNRESVIQDLQFLLSTERRINQIFKIMTNSTYGCCGRQQGKTVVIEAFKEKLALENAFKAYLNERK